MVRKEALTYFATLPRRFRGCGCSENQASLPRQLLEAALGGRNVTRNRFNLKTLCAHASRETTIQYQNEVSSRYFGEPRPKRIERNTCSRQVHSVSVIGNDLMRLRTMSGERNNN